MHDILQWLPSPSFLPSTLARSYRFLPRYTAYRLPQFNNDFVVGKLFENVNVVPLWRCAFSARPSVNLCCG